MRAFVICWRSGVLEIVDHAPVKGALTLYGGEDRERLEQAVWAVARLAYDGKTLLCPGVPEAPDGQAALDAVAAFTKQLKRRLAR